MKNTLAQSMALAATAIGLLTTSAFAQEPNGRNVHLVNYSAEPGRNGSFFQDGPSSWREDSASGTQFHFTEVNRDDWSVYLRDSSRSVSIQLDLFTRTK
jgi:hypothetical protein